MIIRRPSFAGGGGFKVANVIYFIAAWHVFGFAIYSKFHHDQSEKDVNWKKLTSSQQYLKLMSEPGEKVTVIRLQGAKVTENEEKSIEEFTAPK